MLMRFYRSPALTPDRTQNLLAAATANLHLYTGGLQTEYCFYVQTEEPLSAEEQHRLIWLLSETFQPEQFGWSSFLKAHLNTHSVLLEIGPRFEFETPFSSTAVQIAAKCGIRGITRVEHSVRYGIVRDLNPEEIETFLAHLRDQGLYDQMTQMVYNFPLTSFPAPARPDPVQILPLLEEGIAVLEKFNNKKGLGMDGDDVRLCFEFFTQVLKRNPTNVEVFNLGANNSEHSRHHWFRGKHEIDGVPLRDSPMDIIRAAYQAHPRYVASAFKGNAAALLGPVLSYFGPSSAAGPSQYRMHSETLMYVIAKAESHNHPTGVCPFPGAETGVGGEIRDLQTFGRGGIPLAGAAGYYVGNLLVPGYVMPWEKDSLPHPANLKSPLEILIQASNGASHYNNCFGRPTVLGFTRAYGLDAGDGYNSYFKPVMYAAGTGLARSDHAEKHERDFSPENPLAVVLLGGPAYRIGIGGSSASSMISGSNTVELDFASVQRGAPQMENRGERVISACVNLGPLNPIEDSNDLGAAGIGNAISELGNPYGIYVDLGKIPVADLSLSVSEILGNESQERYGLVVHQRNLALFRAICERENCPMAVIGEISHDGRFRVYDPKTETFPVDLPLAETLGNIPAKKFIHTRIPPKLRPLRLASTITLEQALERVLRLLNVCSKNFLVNKADRTVGGRTAQQQCCGPNHIPVADCAVTAHSEFGLSGTVQALGEQPIKGLINPAAMARLSLAESLLNMSGVVLEYGLEGVCHNCNWMWPAKLPGEGPKLIDAALALKEMLIKLRTAPFGGKDSLSLAAKTKDHKGQDILVKGPGSLIIFSTATTDDLRRKATPDLKAQGNILIHIDLSSGKRRLGGSSLAQAYSQLGNDCPDVEDPGLFKRAFEKIQHLVADGSVLSVHDISDGGLITTLLEMAFAGNCGINVRLRSDHSLLAECFAEEPGLVLEVKSSAINRTLSQLSQIPNSVIGQVGLVGGKIRVLFNGMEVLNKDMAALRSIWEKTGNQLERRQANPECIAQQEQAGENTAVPPFRLNFVPDQFGIMGSDQQLRDLEYCPGVAIIREEGTNGDEEMATAFRMAGFEVTDVNIDDLLKNRITLDQFRGIAFPGGFVYADVLGSAKGWAGEIRFNPGLSEQFRNFYHREDTFSFGVCNGCQLMTLLGWVPGLPGIPDEKLPRFITNKSGRFESRFPALRIELSPAIMLREMAGSIIGAWSAHQEGLLHADEEILQYILDHNLAPIRYVGVRGDPTTRYPYNPNGSPWGIAALCSPNGRHLAMMPHTERSKLSWQLAWQPDAWKEKTFSPWLTMFCNAYRWCAETRR